MDTASQVYALHWAVVLWMLGYSWLRSQHILHPHLMFTVIHVMYLGDFLVRGYNDYNIEQIPIDRIWVYQFMILTIIVITTWLTAQIRSPRLEGLLAQSSTAMKVDDRIRRAILIAAVTILVVELVKRFSTIGWSIDEFISQLQLGRGQRVWEQAMYSGNFLFSFIHMVLPLAGVGFAFLSAGSRGVGRIGLLLMLALVLGLLILNGSRTPVGLILAAFGYFWVIERKSIMARVAVVVASVMLVATIFSLMYLFRAVGYSDELIAHNDRQFAVTYHLDDNYYRTIYAYNHADVTGRRWDAPWFFWSIAVNPIPRAIWPEKPLLDDDYYDGFKEEGATNSYLGEIVAMTGPEWSFVFTPLMALFIYVILFLGLNLLKYPFGLPAYLLIGLYAQSSARSLLDLMHDIYLPTAGLLVVWLCHRVAKSPTRSENSGRAGPNYRQVTSPL